MNAVCHRCGGEKSNAFQPCSSCGVVPEDDDRVLAWLFSSAHLNETQLSLAAKRVRNGEMPDPNRHLMNHARAKIGDPKRSDASNTPFSTSTLVAIGAMDLLLTPLAGFAVWWGHRLDRPRAAAQALRITLPIAAALGALWIGLVALRLFAYSSS